MTECALCGDSRKNIRWFANDLPVCKRHYDRIGRIKEIFKVRVKLEELSEPKEEVIDDSTA